MDDATITRLNDINRQFYATIAHAFDETRGKAWTGWEVLINHIAKPTAPYRVLDIGCGNGRFGIFLAEKWGTDNLIYHGVDNSPDLLQSAREALSVKHITFDLQDEDIVHGHHEFTPQYDLVVAFGMIHHIPSAQLRTHLVSNWANAVKAGGYLAFACWRFYEFDRFRERIVTWDNDLADKVEAGDYLLDWRRGTTALRYCHYVDDSEHEALICATNLQLIADYRADGFTNTVNRYSILKKPL